jgi:hypothetical protein
MTSDAAPVVTLLAVTIALGGGARRAPAARVTHRTLALIHEGIGA